MRISRVIPMPDLYHREVVPDECDQVVVLMSDDEVRSRISEIDYTLDLIDATDVDALYRERMELVSLLT